MSWCLLPKYVERFKSMLKSGEITPEKLFDMTPAERIAMFSERFGGELNGKTMERYLEDKFLNKNVEQGLITWAENVLSVPKEYRRDLVSKVRRMAAEGKLLDVMKAKGVLLDEVVEYRTGKKVTLEEVDTITKMSKEVASAEASFDAASGKWSSETARMDYAAKVGAFTRYLDSLESVVHEREFITFMEKEGLLGKAGGLGADVLNLGRELGKAGRQIKAGLFDNSLIGRQMRKTYRPGTWDIGVNRSLQSLGDFWEVLTKGEPSAEKILYATKGEIMSRPDALNGRYQSKEGKLDIGLGEEGIPQSFLERVPFIRRGVMATRVSAETLMMRVRADIASRFYEMAEKKGADLTNPVNTGEINQVVNSMTGRGRITSFSPEGQALMNDLFFSVKFAKSQIQTFSQPLTMKTKFAQHQAMWNLVSLASTTAIISAIAEAIIPDSTEKDPTSSDFGKIKIGSTRYDFSGGHLGLVNLGARLGSFMTDGQTKSSTTGVKSDSRAYGGRDVLDLLSDYAAGKASPFGRMLLDVVSQQTFNREPVTLKTEIETLFKPIILETATDAAKADGILQAITATASDFIGISANTYVFADNWSNKKSKEMEALKKRAGEDKFNAANEKYNVKIQDFLNSETYKNADNGKKEKMLDKKKRETKASILSTFGL